MRKTEAECFDATVLWGRIGVSDKELACLLGSGLSTARRVAVEANAVYRVGGRKFNNVKKIKAYVDAITGE